MPHVNLKLLLVLEKAVANKCLNETKEVVGEIKCHQTEHGDSSPH